MKSHKLGSCEEWIVTWFWAFVFFHFSYYWINCSASSSLIFVILTLYILYPKVIPLPLGVCVVGGSEMNPGAFHIFCKFSDLHTKLKNNVFGAWRGGSVVTSASCTHVRTCISISSIYMGLVAPSLGGRKGDVWSKLLTWLTEPMNSEFREDPSSSK